MTKRSVKKEIILLTNLEAISDRERALISFSEIESALALFSQSGAFGSFVGTKEQGSNQCN